MSEVMLYTAMILIVCMISTKILYRFGVPMLLVFIILGMIFGSDGIVGIHFDDFNFTGQLCSLGLVFIMFYGGYGTNWKMAKPIVVPASLMASLGVLLTAILTGLFCHIVLGVSLLEGLLIGSIVSSTDSASVFAVLRAKKLNLKGSLASLLEIESGSNDPMAYMLTLLIVSMMKDSSSVSILSATSMIISQIIIGFILGIILSKVAIYILKHANFEVEGFYTIFIVSIAILVYSLNEICGGNGYLGVYVAGMILGNSNIPQKKNTFYFFDGISWIMQIILFFMLGLLSFPSQLSSIGDEAVVISIFMIFIARPLVTFVTLSPFKFSTREKLFISWVGLRGAGSLVFAIFAVTNGVNVSIDVFHTIFFIALFSVGIQGSFIPSVAKVLGLINEDGDGTEVLKTFTDYSGEINAELLEYKINKDNIWIGHTIIDMDIPSDILIVMIKRKDKIIIPKGSTTIEEGDILVLTGEDLKKYIDKHNKNK